MWSSFARSFFWRVIPLAGRPCCGGISLVPSWHALDGPVVLEVQVYLLVYVGFLYTVMSRVPPSFRLSWCQGEGEIHPFPAPWWGAINFTIELEGMGFLPFLDTNLARRRMAPWSSQYTGSRHSLTDTCISTPTGPPDACQEVTGQVPLQQGQEYHSPERMT